MKHSIIEIIACLFDSMHKQTLVLPADRTELMGKLQKIGFDGSRLSAACDWLTNLIRQQDLFDKLLISADSIRVFADEEMAKLDLNCRRFILLLEQLGILSVKLREVVICELYQLDQEHIDLIDVKWVVLLVLLSQPTGRDVEQLHKFLLATTMYNI